MNQVVVVEGVTNRNFLERFASAGRVGLAGSTTDRLIKRAQRHLKGGTEWGTWSHALVFQGKRVDGHHWVVESDLDIHRKHIRLGAQENRIAKYFDEKIFPSLAVLDFRLTDAQTDTVIREGLEMIANRTRYSITELFSTAFGLRHPSFRTKENRFSKDNSFYCSAFVQHLYQKIGLDLVPGINAKRNAPEDIFQSPVPHTTYLLKRDP